MARRSCICIIHQYSVYHSYSRQSTASMSNDQKSRETRRRLERCWAQELKWDLFPEPLREGCFQIGKALCIHPAGVLGGLVILASYVQSPAVIRVPGTEWSERALVWLSINMPTGSTKSALYQYLQGIVTHVRERCSYQQHDPAWLLGDASCEKMGDLMASNGGRLLGLYDELTSFLTQLNLYRGKGVTMSHELALFLQLYNGLSWTRSTVTGDANFAMESTALTVGGFSQPPVARTLIEQSGSAEIGLSQRFLWLFPQPSYSRFHTLESVDTDFTESLVDILHHQWKPGKTQNPSPKVFSIKRDSRTFTNYFDTVQEQLETLACTDDLLSGMLSKSKGQTLRVAASLHLLFQVGKSEDVSSIISEEAVSAAINFVQLCCQQTAYMAGRGDIMEEVQTIKASISEVYPLDGADTGSTPAFCLKLPGRRLNLTALLYAKRFRDHGYKTGALAAFNELEEAGLGTVEKVKAKSALKYTFVKAAVPSEQEEKKTLAKKLMAFGVSLAEYAKTMQEEEIVTPQKNKKRSSTGISDQDTGTPTKQLRRSPRKLEYTSPVETPSTT